jgi:hypothetical protein
MGKKCRGLIVLEHYSENAGHILTTYKNLNVVPPGCGGNTLFGKMR